MGCWRDGFEYCAFGMRHCAGSRRGPSFFRIDVGILRHFKVGPKMTPFSWRELTMLILTLGTLVFGAVGVYRAQEVDLPEFDDPQPHVPSTNYGSNYAECHAELHWEVLRKYDDGYRAALACFLFDGTVDPLDLRINVGSLQDIGHRTVDLVAQRNPPGQVGAVVRGRMVLLLLLVPDGVNTSQFATLRQARAFGVKIKAIGSQG